MGNNYFEFKQFTIHHDLCAMKVGTDGVLLGAWANIDQNQNVLDIGTGTGIIAIMMAQRSNNLIEAIDIDEHAVEQAKVNIAKSPWSNRICVYHESLQHFVGKSNKKYSHIVSNPPYFKNSLLPEDKKRTLARHNNSLPFDELINCSKTILTDNGKISLILPYEEGCILIAQAVGVGLFCSRKTSVRTTGSSPFKRILIEFSPVYASCQTQELTIEIAPDRYSEAYMNLTKDFYLNF